MNKKKYIVLTIVSVLAFILITIGVTYSFFSYIGQGSTENTVESGSINFIYEEVNKNGNGISITDAMPIPDSEGKESNNYFDFKVTSSTGTTIAIPYEITARVSEGSDNLADYVKLYLTKVNGNSEQQVALSIYDDLNDSTNTLASQFGDKTLYTDEIPVGASNYTENYRLRMWLNNDSNDGSVLDYSPVYVCSDTQYTNQTDCESNNGVWNPTEQYTNQNKTFSIKINVYANGEQASQQKIESASTTDIAGLKINNTLATENTDSTLNYDYYVTTSMRDANNIEILTLNDGQTYTVENITEQEATTLKQVSTSQNLNLNLGINYLKVTVTSANRQNSKIYVIRVKVTSPNSLEGFALMIYDNNELNGESVDLTTISYDTNQNGFYSTNVTNGYGGKNGTTYFFRGNVTNNYVDFAGFTWRIVRINEDGTVRLILQNGINDNAKYKYQSAYNGIGYLYYTYMNTSSDTTAKTLIDAWYNQNIGNNSDYSSKVASGNYYCEEAKIGGASSHGYLLNTGTTMTIYTDYTPTLGCGTDQNNHGLVNSNVGLLTYDEMLFAGAYPKVSNSKYYLYNSYDFWLMTPGGRSTEWNDASVWGLNSKTLQSQNVSDNRWLLTLRPVINLKTDVTATGTGTSTDPYRIVYN